MNQELWQRILDFDFDNAPGSYTFSVRLSKENRWTRNFTQQALLEYRKFMYLAATSATMVSPSEIVDIVWHQHLIFTQSYKDFCTLLGRQVQHIPSTHNSLDLEKFKIAKEQTARLYQEVFGEQSKTIWDNQSMLQSLNLPQNNRSIQDVLSYALPITAFSLIPAYSLLRPVYLHINNPAFIIIVALIVAGALLYVKQYFNPRHLQSMIDETEKGSFINNLHPYEVACLKTGNINAVINGCLGELLHEELVEIDHVGNFSVPENRPANEPYMQLAIDKIAEYKKIPHKELLEELQQQPAFGNIERSMEAVKQHVVGSEKFVRLFCVNYIVLALPALLIYTRILTGYLREKPITFILLAGIFYTVVIYMHLKLLAENPLGKHISSHYLDVIVPKDEQRRDWQWRYLAEGPALFSAALLTIAYPNYNSFNSSGSGSGCGSSCGSSGDGGSCGGGCGGCGGGD